MYACINVCTLVCFALLADVGKLLSSLSRCPLLSMSVNGNVDSWRILCIYTPINPRVKTFAYLPRYEGIVYLLNNFEQETTVCRENGGECKRDADAVRKYLGLRSTTDNLFQIEKVFAKVKYMDSLDPDNLEAFFEATEDYNTAMNMSNSMAFISQFGEYNPGGGKDEVLKYLNEAQKQVVLAEKALRTIINCIEPPAAAPSE